MKAYSSHISLEFYEGLTRKHRLMKINQYQLNITLTGLMSIVLFFFILGRIAAYLVRG